ncbi:MAG: GTP 3',8-cyclase MoaA [Firmicutes bacterium HGW-Firmicutes-20]|nr:MAG: GTP 3',8-cyclase MoaA [Firmicutes bacterium HGW-Firmicutes-20]PKM88369.1 MAG: GTP 3',8-cyclase MoaA [Firmicutes bacterium HGW-Firmicutes-10]
MIDRFGRDINYLRVSVTDRCNYRCQYCMPHNGVKTMAHEDLLSFEEMYMVIHNFVSLGVKKVRLTGGEPLVRRGILGFIQSLSRIKALEDIALTTNGSLLKEMAADLKKSGLHRVNVSLDTLNPERFKRLTRGGSLQEVLDGIKQAENVGLTVKLNCVLNKDINIDEIRDFVQLSRDWKMDVRFIELMPIGENVDYALNHFVSTKEVLKQCPDLIATEAIDPSSPARYYRLPEAVGKVGLISPLSCNFCHDCNRIRLTPDGKLKPCLHNDLEIDLRTPLRNGENIMPYLMDAITVKPEKHLLDQHQTIVRQMSQIGG